MREFKSLHQLISVQNNDFQGLYKLLSQQNSTRLCPQDTDAPTAATTFMKLRKGHNSGKMVAGKNLFFTIIYISCLIIWASLKEIRLIVKEELMPQDLEDVRTSATLYASHFVGAE
jgi:hypothetical protein